MSEKRYIIVSPSHHKKPRTMFLNKTNSGKDVWCNSVAGTIITWLLSDACKVAEYTPIGLYFVEDKDWLTLLTEGDMPKFADFIGWAKEKGCKIIRYLPETQAAPEVQSELTPEEKREYVLYYYKQHDAWNTYYERGGGETHDKSEAYLMTLSEATEKVNELTEKGQYRWVYKKINTQETPTPEAAPELKKPIGFILEHDTTIDKPYFCSDVRCENVIEWDGISVQIFQTSEYAQFIADLQYIETGIVWQVKSAFR